MNMAYPNSPHPANITHEAVPGPQSTTATENVPPSINSDDPQSEHANDVIQQSELRPPIAQFIINFVLQIAGFAAAIAFGIFAVKSVRESIVANDYANQALDTARAANQLALLTLCLSTESTVGSY